MAAFYYLWLQSIFRISRKFVWPWKQFLPKKYRTVHPHILNKVFRAHSIHYFSIFSLSFIRRQYFPPSFPLSPLLRNQFWNCWKVVLKTTWEQTQRWSGNSTEYDLAILFYTRARGSRHLGRFAIWIVINGRFTKHIFLFFFKMTGKNVMQIVFQSSE